MAEMAWPEDLGHGTFTGRFGWMDADGANEGTDPDITAASGGTVEITPAVAAVKYTGAAGPLSLVARRAVGIIDDEGYLCTKRADGTAGPRGMSFPATDNAALSPAGWTYRVAVKLPDGITLPTFSTSLATGATVDLATAVPVDASPGVVKIVDDTIAVRAEAAAGRAEQAAADVEANIDQIVADYLATAPDLRGEPGPDGRGIASISDPDADSRVTITFTDGSTATVQAIRGADGHTPAITWEGTSIVVDGEQGPDLRGDPGEKGETGATGPASTAPGPAGPPGAVPTTSDYLVVGPGRPDAPTTTGLSSAQIAALPVGCEYRSTDGASVGAWVWRKRPTGWTVTQGDTGWVTLTHSGVWSTGGMIVRRVDSNLYWKVGTGEYGIFRWAAAFTNGAGETVIPAPFRPQGTSAYITLRTDGTTKAVVGALEIQVSGYVVRRTTDNGTLTSDALSGPTSNAWPTTLTP